MGSDSDGGGTTYLGIDLGTTNSEVAALVDGKVEVLGTGDAKMLPSCVGIAPGGELLVGQPALNQWLLYPERTVRSIKRRMGSDEQVTLGDRRFTPAEISSLILRALVDLADRQLGAKASRRAVITVPAFFSDAQRQATREAGKLAGLEVLRILNEPTAASLAYGYGGEQERTVLVYDLGGGTFDVSLVAIQGDVTEVLASHGNNQLGGDDFDRLLVERLMREIRDQHGVDLTDRKAAYSRVWWAATEAKKRLSYEPTVTIREESLFEVGGKPIDLVREVSRDELEDLVRPLIESTLVSVVRTLADAGKEASDLDAILLVGGSTRMPIVARTVADRTGVEPHREVHPDLCVALGAGVLASRLAGHDVNRVLVDVSPYSFGPSYRGELDGRVYSHCYTPIIARNTPLPVTRTEPYTTSSSFQDAVRIQVYQGDDPDALKNILVGDFTVEGLTQKVEPNRVLCRMSLDLDGILEVTAIEADTGLSKHIAITGALQRKTDTEIAIARRTLDGIRRGHESALATLVASDDDEELDAPATSVALAVRTGGDGEGAPVTPGSAGWQALVTKAEALLARSRAALDGMQGEDREEAIECNAAIADAIEAQDSKELAQVIEGLADLLYYLEGR